MLKAKQYLFSVVFIVLTALLTQKAQAIFYYDAPYYGRFNGYPIGDRNDAVTVKEYCCYLNEKASHERCWFYSAYYDASFMECAWDERRYTFSMTCDSSARFRAPIKRVGFSPDYTYYVQAYHDYAIIVAVASSRIQKEFTEWRKALRASTDVEQAL